jgi:hypothetical protein
LLEHPAALRVLLGQWGTPLEPEDVVFMAEGNPAAAEKLRSGPGENSQSPLAEVFNDIIEQAGGWPHVVEAAREWIKKNPARWAIIVDFICWAKPNRSRIDGSPSGRVTQKHGISRATLWRIMKNFPGELAEMIIKLPSGFN